MINMRAQHITFNKAIKTVKILKNFYCKILTVLMALLKVICWALIFIIRIRFPPGKSLVTFILVKQTI